MSKNFVLKSLPRWMGVEKDDHNFILNLACLRLMQELYDYGNKPMSLWLYKKNAKTDSSIIDEAVKKLSDDKIIVGEVRITFSGEHDTYVRLRKSVVGYMNIYRYVMSHPDSDSP